MWHNYPFSQRAVEVEDFFGGEGGGAAGGREISWTKFENGAARQYRAVFLNQKWLRTLCQLCITFVTISKHRFLGALSLLYKLYPLSSISSFPNMSKLDRRIFKSAISLEQCDEKSDFLHVDTNL